MSSSEKSSDEEVVAIHSTLEQELARVQSSEFAEAVLAHTERYAEGSTEESAGNAAAGTGPASGVIAAAQHGPDPAVQVARVLTAAAAESVAPTATAKAVVKAAETPSQMADRNPAAREGRRLLRAAVLKRMDRFQALDIRIFLAVNDAPHPAWLDRTANALTIVTTGGWIWVVGIVVAHRLRVPRSGTAFCRLLPVLVATTFVAEHPVKAYVRRRRPFVEVVQALVVGKRPGSWSFPSGHTAASFCAAWVLSTVWPTRSPSFFALASLVGASRIYVGAHYPGDVLSGAFIGVTLGDALRRVVQRALSRSSRH